MHVHLASSKFICVSGMAQPSQEPKAEHCKPKDAMPKSKGKGCLSKGNDKGNPSKGKGKDNEMGAYAWIWSPLCVAWHHWPPLSVYCLGHGPPPPLPYFKEPLGLSGNHLGWRTQPASGHTEDAAFLSEVERELMNTLRVSKEARDQFVKQTILTAGEMHLATSAGRIQIATSSSKK